MTGSSFFGDSLGLLIEFTACALTELKAMVDRLRFAWPSMWVILSRAHSLFSLKYLHSGSSLYEKYLETLASSNPLKSLP